MSEALLQTKLYIPPTRPSLVPRPHLIDKLNAGLNSKLTLVSAPAGFGKTTLLSRWVRGCERHVAWVSLDKGDNDPTRFFLYFIAALQRIKEGIGEEALITLRSPQPASYETLLTGLINNMTETAEPSVLILDDFHLISERQIHDALTFLLDNLPPTMHLIISGRADPPWPLARLRARSEMNELRTNDLRFTSQETAAFLNDMMKLNLSPEDVAALEDRTEGWIAGLQMAALSMRGRKDVTAFISAFTGSHRFILDYLVEEVLEQQPHNVQEFLLKSSILERMAAPLCDAVTGGCDSQAILIQLDRANLFLIPLDDERRWYRYHHLFADLLRSHLEQSYPDQVPALHHQASVWYEQNKLFSEAVSHAFAANDLERVAHLVEYNALAMMDRGELATLVEWLNALPNEVKHSQPRLYVSHAWALIYTGQLDAVGPLLQNAENELAQRRSPGCEYGKLDEATGADSKYSGPNSFEERNIAGHIFAIRAYLVGLRGDVSQEIILVRQALEHLTEKELMARGFAAMLLASALRWSGDLVGAIHALTEAIAINRAAGNSHIGVLTTCNLAARQIEQGQLRKAFSTCKDAIQIANEYAMQGGQQLPVTGFVYIRMSSVLREWNDLEAASRYAIEGLKLCKRWGWAEGLIRSYHEVAKVLQAIGDVNGALNAIQDAKIAASELSAQFIDIVDAWEAQLRLVQGDIRAASCWVQKSELSVDDKLSFQSGDWHYTFARFLIAQGNQQDKEPGDRSKSLDQALGLLVRLLEAVEAVGAMGYAIEILILQAIALQSQGKGNQALKPLERALSLAEPEGYVRIFIGEGALMGQLLRQAITKGIAVAYSGRLLTALKGEAETKRQPGTTAQASMIEPLSERELEVLRLLTTHLSSSDIAQELTISVNTVRTHIKSIYSKLNVHSRNDAVQRARELDIL